MKKALSVILAIMLFAVCFTACSESPAETKTDTKPVENANSVVVSQVEQPTPDESQPQQNSAPAQQEQTNETSLPAQQPASTPNQPTTTVTPEKIHGDVAQNNPTFISEQALQTWLQKGSGAYEAQRAQYLTQASKNNTIAYFWPSKDLGNLIPFKKVEYHSTSHIYEYYYHNDLVIGVNTDKTTETYQDFEKFYIECKEKYNAKVENYGLVKDEKNKIDFYYTISDLNNVFIYWEQYGLVHTAQLFKRNDLLDKLFPHLVLEQVTVNLNSDHVTQ